MELRAQLDAVVEERHLRRKFGGVGTVRWQYTVVLYKTIVFRVQVSFPRGNITCGNNYTTPAYVEPPRPSPSGGIQSNLPTNVITQLPAAFPLCFSHFE